MLSIEKSGCFCSIGVISLCDFNKFSNINIPAYIKIGLKTPLKIKVGFGIV